MTVGNAADVYLQKIRASISLKPRSKEYRELMTDFIRRSWPSLFETDGARYLHATANLAQPISTAVLSKCHQQQHWHLASYFRSSDRLRSAIQQSRCRAVAGKDSAETTRASVTVDSRRKLQIAGFDISRSGVSKIEARLSYVHDKALLYLAEVLKYGCRNSFRLDHRAIESTILSRNLKRRDFDLHRSM